MEKPVILVTNDDGVDAPGIKALAQAFRRIADVWVVAPLVERSGCGMSLTIRDPIRSVQRSDQVYAISGTPGDCVHIARGAGFLPREPDYIVSGINRGGNLGQDTMYSGTVSACMQGALDGIPGLAVSIEPLGTTNPWSHDHELNYELAADVAVAVFERRNKWFIKNGQVLNLNVPSVEKSALKGVKKCPLGRRVFPNSVDSRQDPRGGSYHWIGLGELSAKKLPGSDLDWIGQSFATLTVLQPNLADNVSTDKIDEEVFDRILGI